MRRPPLQGINPLDIFMHARRFQEALQQLRSIDSNNARLALEVAQPTMVLSALLSELYLKCLTCMETGLTPQGHYLDALFEGLSKESKDRIEHLWRTKIVPAREPMWARVVKQLGVNGKDIPRDLLGALRAAHKSFEEMRYSYEPGAKGAIFTIGDFPDVLRKVILEKHPEWERLRHPVKELPISDGGQK